MRCTNRQQPSAPSSVHSMSRSGGVSDSMNQRIVSAPKTSMIASGAITFFFDFDIFSDGPTMTGSSGAFAESLAVALLDFVGQSHWPFGFRVAIGFVTNHALGEEPGERLVDMVGRACCNRAGEEPCIEQMQDRVLDATDILIDRQPVIAASRPTVPRRCVSQKRAKYQDEIDKGIERVGVAPRRLATSGQATYFHVG